VIRLVHERELDATPAQVGGLIDGLASAEDRLWPSDRWPPIWLDRPLGVGAKGGHGPVRYEVSDYEPGRRVCFRFDPKTFAGHHWFEVTSRDGRTLLRHVAEGRTRSWMRLAWPVALRWMHDAAVRDSLDRVQAQLRGTPWSPRRLGGWVRMLRAIGQMVMGEQAVPRGSRETDG
jgi:hypothetical protein